ncbi:hypothetical protein OPT61_g3031 [Boeremia exigua]|uniref:Uncharacterized protein n=1 Tax=Boeremia exigua TaxID=749465 RepID=A0ACC2IJB8_9PLEO|nr:hypothetical protein OPT61_g3031 [Boeremia exigua]
MTATHRESVSRIEDQPYQISPIETTTAPWLSLAYDTTDTHAQDTTGTQTHKHVPTDTITSLLFADSQASRDGENRETQSSLHSRNVSTSMATTTTPLLDAESAAAKSQCWPTSPRRIQSSWGAIILNGVFDVLLFSCAIAFLTFAAVVSHHDQVPTADYPRTTAMLLNATKYVRKDPLFKQRRELTTCKGPTVFPVLFALIVGRATHTVLRWRLERGESIGVLDTLAASTSLTSTLVSQFHLRAISLYGNILVSVWMLSPIGGQASIRQMTIGMRSTTESTSFDYFIHNGHNLYSFVSGAGYTNNPQSSIANTILIGGIIGSLTTTSTVDTWGNVKIPRIEYYESKAVPDNEGWLNTAFGSPESYSSMIGIPISGTNATQFINYKMTIQTSYIQTECSVTPKSKTMRTE